MTDSLTNRLVALLLHDMAKRDDEAGYWALGFGHGEDELSGEPEFCDSAPVGCGAV